MFVVGLLLLRAIVLACSVQAGRALTGDEPTYDGVARSLLSGHGYSYFGRPWVWKPPLWPTLLAAVQFFCGRNAAAVVFVQALCDAGTAILACLVARTIFASERAGWVALALVALWPPFLREARLLQTEPLFTLGVALSLYAFVRWAMDPTARGAFVLGLASGFAAMVRPNGLAPAAALVLGWIALDRKARSRWPTLAALALGAALVIAPWAARNAAVFHEFIPFSVGGGEVFAMGTSVAADGRWDHVIWVAERERLVHEAALRAGHRLSATEAEAALYRVGVQRWREDPRQQFGLWARRLWRTVALPMEGGSSWVRLAFVATLAALYALAVAGALAAWRRGERAGRIAPALAFAFVLNVLLLSTIAASSRYTEPVRTMVLVLAAGAIGTLGSRRPEQP